jgi:cysteine synthase A
MRAEGRAGSVVTLICDDGHRYDHTYYDDDWVAARGWDLDTPTRVLDEFVATGTWTG